MKSKKSIATRIILLCVIISLIPLLLSNLISASISLKAGEQNVYTKMEDRTQSVSAQVAEYINKAYAVVEGLSYGDDILSMDPQKQHNILATTVKNNPYFLLFYQQGIDGMQTARSEGELVNRAGRWWFEKELQEQKPYVSKSYFSVNGNVAVTSIVFPIWDKQDKLQAILATDLNLSKLQEITDQYNNSDTYSVLIDGDGNVIAHPNTEFVSQMYNYKNATKTLTIKDSSGQDVSKEEPIPMTDSFKSLVGKLLNGESGVEEFKNEQGNDEIYSYAPITLPGNSDSWGVVTIQSKEAAFSSTMSMIKYNLLLTIFIELISILISFLFTRQMTTPLNNLEKSTNRIANGDLDVEINVKSDDEIGRVAQAVNKTVTRLRSYVNYISEITETLDKISDGILEFELTYEYVGEFSKVKAALLHIGETMNKTMTHLKQVADEVACGSEQVSCGAQALAQGATEQAASVEELAATITEISSQVKLNAENAKLAYDQSATSGSDLTAGSEKMNEMMGAMADISQSSNQISKIIKTIEDIAFQTNILALNAAVEAARAGVAGKGFAVVADEVRNLANKSSAAAKNTTELIGETVAAVANGTKIAEETSKAILDVVVGSQNVNNLIGKIATASEKQAVSIIQVTQGVEQISSVVQTNSATAEESAAASTELSGQAQTLKKLVSRFRLKSVNPDAALLNEKNSKGNQ